MFGLPDNALAAMQGVFGNYPQVEKVIIYGSRAKGNFRPGSDIDLTILGEALDSSTLSRIMIDLDDLNMPYMLKEKLFNQIDSEILFNQIERAGKVFYLSPDLESSYNA